MTTTRPQFTWRPGEVPPSIEPHSDAKLRLLEAYLDRYFDVLCALPRRGTFRIALVDAFAGGGLFQRDGSDRFGSPLVMLDAVSRARARVNVRRPQALQIEPKFFFVDQNPDTVDYLRQALRTTPVGHNFEDAIAVRQGNASEALPGIIREIANWNPRGHSIFFLDQCGIKDVPNRDVRQIYQDLPKSEVIVTYPYGTIHDYMHEGADFLAALAPFELTAAELRALLRERERQGGRYFAGRLLGKLLKDKVGARFASRFFLRSEAAGRDMWFVHYSKIPRSRLVMNEAHWAIKNASVTQGEAGIDMLGFRPNWEDQIGLDFVFDDTDEGRIHGALVQELPSWLEQFDLDEGITFELFLALTADNTAATEAQFRTVMASLEGDEELEVRTPSGRRKRPDALLRPNHRVLLPRQGKFYFS